MNDAGASASGIVAVNRLSINGNATTQTSSCGSIFNVMNLFAGWLACLSLRLPNNYLPNIKRSLSLFIIFILLFPSDTRQLCGNHDVVAVGDLKLHFAAAARLECQFRFYLIIRIL